VWSVLLCRRELWRECLQALAGDISSRLYSRVRRVVVGNVW
jgi:hypothetical protein